MIKHFAVAIAVLSAIVFFADPPSAHAWGSQRTGRHGALHSRNITCTPGSKSCTGTRSVTGANGKTVSQTRSGSCTSGSCTSTATTTGPNGKTVTKQASTTCANGTCTQTNQFTGSGGKTDTTTRTFQAPPLQQSQQ